MWELAVFERERIKTHFNFFEICVFFNIYVAVEFSDRIRLLAVKVKTFTFLYAAKILVVDHSSYLCLLYITSHVAK